MTLRFQHSAGLSAPLFARVKAAATKHRAVCASTPVPGAGVGARGQGQRDKDQVRLSSFKNMANLEMSLTSRLSKQIIYLVSLLHNFMSFQSCMSMDSSAMHEAAGNTKIRSLSSCIYKLLYVIIYKQFILNS